MATTPGILTDWPWKNLGSFKFALLTPFVARSAYMAAVKGEWKNEINCLLIFPFILTRILHNQIWITLARHGTAKGKNRIVDRSIEFDQVDRESNWDDHILFSGMLLYSFLKMFAWANPLPIWRTDGVILTILLHAGPVEFLYYWIHRALHHHYLYSRYHSHHHSSIVTEPITAVIHPFLEEMVYYVLFSIPPFVRAFTKTDSLACMFGYITFLDLMNNLGHCNLELIPKWIYSTFPPLKYILYTPTFHALHHTQFRTNYSLFMPFYDYIYGTMDKASETLHETALGKQEDSPDVVHLTHLTTPESIYHLRLGFSSFAAKPFESKWYIWLMWPVTRYSMIMTWIFGKTFIVERNAFKDLKFQSWAIPRYLEQYMFEWHRDATNRFIENAILDAEVKGTKVLSLGLLNQAEELNGSGELFVKMYPELSVKVVDGSSLAVAIVLNGIPKGTTQVLLRGKISKVASAIASELCERGIQVATSSDEEYKNLKLTINSESNLLLSKTYTQKVWLVGDGLTKEEQKKAAKGTLFIPFSTIPPKKIRKDCIYNHIPAMLSPPSFENLHACEDWLPRRVMSASRVAGILHALEGWDEHEVGNSMFSVEKVWKASLKHGFQPLINPF